MLDWYGHKNFAGESCFRKKYPQLVRSRRNLLKQFKLINFDVLISPEEEIKSFIEIKSDLTLSKSMCLALCERVK